MTHCRPPRLKMELGSPGLAIHVSPELGPEDWFPLACVPSRGRGPDHAGIRMSHAGAKNSCWREPDDLEGQSLRG